MSGATNIDRSRSRLLDGHPGGQCPVCTQSGPTMRYVSLGVPAFLMNAGVELPPSGGIYRIDTESMPGAEVHEVHDLVADAFKQQTIVRELIVCEGCIGAAAELIGYGDLLDAETAREEAVKQREEAVKQRENLERRVVELEDAVYAEHTGRVAAEASLAAATRSNGHSSEPASKPAKRKAAA